MAKMWQERADYGHFFYRIPNGESAADAYDRISGFNESLWRLFLDEKEDFASVCVLVTHGLMTRVFLMKWYHFSVEYFEDLRNVDHCEFVVLKLDEGSGKYRLHNRLKTWSELRRRDRTAREEGEKKVKEEVEAMSPEIPVRKKWYGCIDGSGTRGDDFARRQAMRRRDTGDLFKDDEEFVHSSDYDDLDLSSDHDIPHSTTHDNSVEADIGLTSAPRASTLKARAPLRDRPNRLDYLRTGRDGGGSRSGANSPNLNSGSEESDVDATSLNKFKAVLSNHKKRGVGVRSAMAMAMSGKLEIDKPEDGRARADALGDQSDADEEENARGNEIERMQWAEQSVDGSVR